MQQIESMGTLQKAQKPVILTPEEMDKNQQPFAYSSFSLFNSEHEERPN